MFHYSVVINHTCKKMCLHVFMFIHFEGKNSCHFESLVFHTIHVPKQCLCI